MRSRVRPYLRVILLSQRSSPGHVPQANAHADADGSVRLLSPSSSTRQRLQTVTSLVAFYGAQARITRIRLRISGNVWTLVRA